VDTYLTVKEVAELVKLSVQTIRRYTMNKEIPFHKIHDRAVRFRKSEIEEWVEKRKAEKAKAQKEEPQGGGLFTETDTGGEV
jgi:excisionase family DNA binding protein